MDKDRIVGAAKDVAGKVEGAAGDIAAMQKPVLQVAPMRPPAQCKTCMARPRMPFGTLAARLRTLRGTLGQ